MFSLCCELFLVLSCIFCCTFWVNNFHCNFPFSLILLMSCRLVMVLVKWVVLSLLLVCCASSDFGDITVCDCHVCMGEPFYFYLFLLSPPSPPLALSPFIFVNWEPRFLPDKWNEPVILMTNK